MLMHPSAMIIFKPIKSTFPKFDGLDEGEIPLFPSEHNFQISTSSRKKVKFHCQQYTLTPGYTFTLNKGQGHTLGSIMVDIHMRTPTTIHSKLFQCLHCTFSSLILWKIWDWKTSDWWIELERQKKCGTWVYIILC